jgi:FMN reductase
MLPHPPSAPSLVAVLGSVTPPGRLHRAVAESLDRLATRTAVAARLIDLAGVRIGLADGRSPEALGDDTAEVVAAIAAADAVLLATPVYRGSLTGSLKNLLDHVPVAALRDTPVAIASMGATDHHLLGAERHLRDVLSFFGALVAPNAAYLTSRDFADGAPTVQAAERLDALLDATLTLADGMGGRRLGPPPLAAGRG